MRDSFVFYRSFYESIKRLPPEDFKNCFLAIAEYALNGTEPETEGIERTVFELIKPQIDSNNQRYENGKKGGRPTKKSKEMMEESKKARNSWDYTKWKNAVLERDGNKCCLCGQEEDLHAHHKKGFDEYPELRFEVDNGITLCRQCHTKIHSEKNQKKPSDNQDGGIGENQKPNVYVYDNDIKKKDTNVSKEKATRFIPPTFVEVSCYVKEKGYNVDPDKFLDFYESKGWMVGKNKMKDWKAAVRNWSRSQRQEVTTKASKFSNFSERQYSDADYKSLIQM